MSKLFASEHFPMLMLIARICRVLAWVVGIGGSLAILWDGLVTFSRGNPVADNLGNLVGLLWVALSVFSLIVLAEAIRVILAIELNTRRTAEALERARE